MPPKRVRQCGEGLEYLRPYEFHGVSLAVSGAQAVGDCPFCGREAKFCVQVSSGLWRCLVCAAGTEAGGGNPLVFIRTLYQFAQDRLLAKESAAKSVGRSVVRGSSNGALGFVATVASARGCLTGAAVRAWGVVESARGEWLVPGYGVDGKLDQVYRRVRIQDKGEWVWRMMPTPGVWPDGKVHALHLPPGDFDPTRPNVVVCEGPWDGMLLYEVWDDRDFGKPLLHANVVAVPGCNVWRDEWTELCKGKHVTLMYDSDHPREYVPGRKSKAGYDGMVRVCKRLCGVAAAVRYLNWGEPGYDPSLKDGWDVSDHLRQGKDRKSRTVYLADLMSKVVDSPREWFIAGSPHESNGRSHSHDNVESMSCSSFQTCVAAWEEATRWRGELTHGMAVLLAVCASTTRAGNQLFLDLIASPGSLKTTMCRALLVSSKCVHVENVTKILSGFKKRGDPEADCSFLARSNGLTWVTCEFDTIANLPVYNELMSKMRRIFDGETTSTYGNDDRDRIYTALRTPWIRAGTPKMLDKDQSQLGDRFLRYIISDPDATESRLITKSAIRSERAALSEESGKMSGSILDPKMRRAYALTGGYVDWLRDNVDSLIDRVHAPDAIDDAMADCAELAAALRARPTDEKKKVESYDVKELPTRLGRQNFRLAKCVAFAMNKPTVDQEVCRIVRKVSLDTACGTSLNLVKWLCAANPQAEGTPYQESGGLGMRTIENWTGMPVEKVARYMSFLRGIGVVESREVRRSVTSWFLTDDMYALYSRVMSI